jgi:hypothetical protein
MVPVVMPIAAAIVDITIISIGNISVEVFF